MTPATSTSTAFAWPATAFSAISVGGAGFDTQLFLFTGQSGGVATGKVANDDDAANRAQSLLPTGPTTYSNGEPLTYPPGPYFLAISSFANLPLDASETPIFLGEAATDVAPSGPAAGPLASWSGNGQSFGPYTIALTGATSIGQGACAA